MFSPPPAAPPTEDRLAAADSNLNSQAPLSLNDRYDGYFSVNPPPPLLREALPTPPVSPLPCTHSLAPHINTTFNKSFCKKKGTR